MITTELTRNDSSELTRNDSSELTRNDSSELTLLLLRMQKSQLIFLLSELI